MKAALWSAHALVLKFAKEHLQPGCDWAGSNCLQPTASRKKPSGEGGGLLERGVGF